ncbi:MAG: hypothetical protein V4671_32355 [Armatimonadota bacterium]
MATLDIIVGSWDDISEHTEMLADRQVRVIVLPKPTEGRAAELKLPCEEAERLLDELTDIGMDAPAWPDECCVRQTEDAEKDAD